MSKNKKNNADKEFVPYEESLALKEIGFDDPVFAVYDYNGKDREQLFLLTHVSQEEDNLLEPKDICNSNIGESISAPAFFQAFRWFRDHLNIFSTILVDQTMEPKFCYSISRYKDFDWESIVFSSDLYYTYEAAELDCLTKIIEIAYSDKVN